jgi:O-methyltransferase involved in polyketide biosynthesis
MPVDHDFIFFSLIVLSVVIIALATLALHLLFPPGIKNPHETRAGAAPKIKTNALSDVAETLLLPLYYRALESQRPDALLKDEQAVVILRRLDYDFSKFKIASSEQAAAIIRVRIFDHCAHEFLARHPDGILVNIGCGLDTRFSRLDNGTLECYDLDLPNVIELRRQLVPKSPRCHVLASSALDVEWMDALPKNRPVLLMAEGVFPYLEEREIKKLVLALNERFAGSELLFDVLSPALVWMHNIELRFTGLQATLRWGLKRSRDIERWSPGIRLLDEWFYFDQPEARLRGLGLMRFIPVLNKSASIVHYRLGEI